MDKNELAAKMLQWAKAQQQADALKAEIETAVMSLGKTQTVGNVKATYRKGRKSYDYKAGADGHPMVNGATMELFTIQPTPRIDWRGICKHVGIDEPPFSVGKPSASVKIV